MKNPAYKTPVKKELKLKKAATPYQYLAGRPGFEPGLTESESVVLPLDDLPEIVQGSTFRVRGL